MVFGGLGLVLAGAAYLPATLLAPLEKIEPALVTVAAPENPPVELAWPRAGTAAIGAVGFPGVLAQSAETGPHSIASITKVVTSLVVLQERPLAVDEDGPTIVMTEQDVTGYYRQLAENGSAEPVAEGLALTQRQLLEVVLIASANNYAETLARWAFGSQEAFLEAAGAWLDSHGLSSTVLRDATGLDPRNVSTAADIVELGKLALADPVVEAIVSTTSVTLPYVGTIENTNKLLGWKGVDGIKTGTVELDDVCLLFATTLMVGERAIDLVGVVLGSTSHEALEAAVQELLTTAMQGFREIPLVSAGEVFAGYSTEWEDTAAAVAAESASAVVWGGVQVARSVQVDPISTGERGDRVGSLRFTIEGETTTVPLVLDDPLDDPGPWWRLTHPFG